MLAFKLHYFCSLSPFWAVDDVKGNYLRWSLNQLNFFDLAANNFQITVNREIFSHICMKNFILPCLTHKRFLLLHLYNKWLNNVVHDIHFSHTSLYFSFGFYYYYTLLYYYSTKLFTRKREEGRKKISDVQNTAKQTNKIWFMFLFFLRLTFFFNKYTKLRFLLPVIRIMIVAVSVRLYMYEAVCWKHDRCLLLFIDDELLINY